jgi:CheY-like chemotaxis protein
MHQTPIILQTDQKVILVVDDDPGILKFVSGLLTDSNYHVLIASGGAEALEQSKKYKGDIHLLLSDFQMPTMTGVDLATEISKSAGCGYFGTRLHAWGYRRF